MSIDYRRYDKMAPKIKFSKEEIIAAALDLARKEGIDAVTARKLGDKLGTSPRPIFTWFDNMGEVRLAVYDAAKTVFKQYLEKGLSEPIPFLGAGRQHICFAKEETCLYKLLFLTKPNGTSGGVQENMEFMQELVLDSVMRIYNMSEAAAKKYFRNMWLVSTSFATMIVTDDCPFTDEEMSQVLSEISLSVCMGLKKVKGMAAGSFDRDAIFSELKSEYV